MPKYVRFYILCGKINKDGTHLCGPMVELGDRDLPEHKVRTTYTVGRGEDSQQLGDRLGLGTLSQDRWSGKLGATYYFYIGR